MPAPPAGCQGTCFEIFKLQLSPCTMLCLMSVSLYSHYLTSLSKRPWHASTLVPSATCEEAAALCVQVLFVGGAGEACSGSSTPASNTSYLIDVTPGADHSLVTEHMAFPRVVSTRSCSHPLISMSPPHTCSMHIWCGMKACSWVMKGHAHFKIAVNNPREQKIKTYLFPCVFAIEATVIADIIDPAK